MFVGSVYRVDPVLAALKVQFEAGQVLVSWPVSSTSDELEETSNLNPAAWTRVISDVTITGSMYSTILPSTGARRFLRVRRAW